MAILTDQALANLLDMAGGNIFDQLGGPQPSGNLLNKFTAISFVSRVTLNSSFSSTVAVGKPIQGNMRQLALARWNYMYPS